MQEKQFLMPDTKFEMFIFVKRRVFTFFTVWIGPTFNSQLIYLEFKDTFYAKKDLEVIFRLSKSISISKSRVLY